MKILLTSLKATTLFVFGSIMVLTIGAYLNLPLPLKPLAVKTGSMEPTIPAGSLVLVTKKSADIIGINYVEGDVVTFKSGNDLVSHRVVSVDRSTGQKLFQVKGDANKTADTKLIAEKDVVGKVNFSVPYIGRFVDFVKQPLGFLLLIIIPTLLIIISEVIAIWEELKKKPVKKSDLDFAKPFAMFFLAAIFMGSSHAFFSDVATSTNNTFSAAPIFPGAPGSVVINELMWMGSQGNSADEWVELRNMTGSPIDISGWVITDIGPGGNDITIPASQTIPANGFYIVSNDTEAGSVMSVTPNYVVNLSMNDGGEQFILSNASAVTIDIADVAGGGWYAGANPGGQTAKSSMERNAIPGDGTVSTNWHTATTQVNIDAGKGELATPGAIND